MERIQLNSLQSNLGTPGNRIDALEINLAFISNFSGVDSGKINTVISLHKIKSVFDNLKLKFK